MGLRNITIPEVEVAFGDGGISVRGVSFSDLMVLVDTYGPQAAIVFQKVQDGGTLQTSDVKLLIGTLAKEFPAMVTAVIALAADVYETEGLETVGKLPFNVQIELVEAVFGLTFTGESDIKKLMESLTKMMVEVSGALKEVQAPLSQTGIGAFAAA